MKAGTWCLSVCTKTGLFPIADWSHNGARGPASPTCLHIHPLHLQQKPGINSLCSGLKRAIKKKHAAALPHPRPPGWNFEAVRGEIPKTHTAQQVFPSSLKDNRCRRLWLRFNLDSLESWTLMVSFLMRKVLFFFLITYFDLPWKVSVNKRWRLSEQNNARSPVGSKGKWHGYSTFQFARSRLHRWQSPLRRCR